ncbi:MAG: hypothetical protein ACREJ6_03995 [Candidatus Methylomirabilis sp.]
MISGALFFTRYVLDVMAGPPPSTGAEIIVWVEANRLVLSFVSEVLFFASMSLVPAVIALYLTLASIVPGGRLVYGVVGSYITARFAPHSPMRHSLVGLGQGGTSVGF